MLFKKKSNPDDELTKYGKSIKEVISKIGTIENTFLIPNIDWLINLKETKNGLNSLNQPERYFYVLSGLLREVNNGGFGQFFFNSTDRLAYDLIPALQAIGSKKVILIAEKAMNIFGKPNSLEENERCEYLGSISNNFEDSLWEKCDSDFFECTEYLDDMLIDYVKNNIDNFTA